METQTIKTLFATQLLNSRMKEFVCVCVCVRECTRVCVCVCVCVCPYMLAFRYCILKMDICCASKLLKYQPLHYASNWSLGHAHKMCVLGLQMCGPSRRKAKRPKENCSVSATTCSLFIRRRSCHLYPLTCK